MKVGKKLNPIIYFFLIIFALAFWPFTLGFLIVRFLLKTKRIHNYYLRVGLIAFCIFLTLFFGSAWVAAMTSSSPQQQKKEIVQKTEQPTGTPTKTATEELLAKETGSPNISPIDTPPIEATPTPTETASVMPSTAVTQANQTRQSGGIYPNHLLTPGDVFPNVIKEQVCTPGYSSSVRDVSVNLKVQVYSEYGVAYPQTAGMYEVDHFVPLELGGSNSISNLWLEPANPRPGYHEKDQVENYLHKQVCNGALSLQEAQNKIMSDWYQVYQAMGGTGSIGTTTGSTTGSTIGGTTSTGSTGNTGTSASTTTSDRPAGATGKCVDGTYTNAAHHQGACSHHQGVAQWF